MDKNRSLFGRWYLLFDIILLFAAYWLTYLIKLVWLEKGNTPEIYVLYWKWLTVVIPVFVLTYFIFHFYRPRKARSKVGELLRIIQANAMGVMFMTLLLYYVKENDVSRVFLIYFACINSLLLWLQRLVTRALRHAKRKHHLHVLLVGYSKSAQAYIDRILANRHLGYVIDGILDDQLTNKEYKGIKVIGPISLLEEILAKNETSEVVITLTLSEFSKLNKIVNICEKAGVHTKFVPDYQDILPTNPYTEDLFGLPVIHIRHVPLSNPVNAFEKRALDLFVGILAFIVFSPVMLVTAIAIKLSSKGPLIYCQERVGRHNKPFKMYKFRSMVVQTKESEQDKWTTKGDSRVTKVGAFIRKTSIDELPQIINVIKGDMSLVGPRPERPFFVDKFKEEIPRYMVKHQVRPGMTGWAQVNGWRGDTDIRERIECDLYYIENWTFGFDIKIMFLTVFKGFVNKNAY